MKSSQNILVRNRIEILTDRRMYVVAFIPLFTILTALGANISIPIHPVPFTLQTFFVLLAGAFLGPLYGFASMSIYLLAGLVGLPVFSGGGFGLMKLLGPTGGYLAGFPIAAFAVGYLVNRFKGYAGTLFAMFVGLIVIFACGTLYLNAVLLKDWKATLAAGMMIFSWWDMVKLFAAASIVHAYTKFSKNKTGM